MTARYHSLTCETVCPGWGCECWCHECPPIPVENPVPQRDSTNTNGKIGAKATPEDVGASTPGPRPPTAPED